MEKRNYKSLYKLSFINGINKKWEMLTCALMTHVK